MKDGSSDYMLSSYEDMVGKITSNTRLWGLSAICYFLSVQINIVSFFLSFSFPFFLKENKYKQTNKKIKQLHKHSTIFNEVLKTGFISSILLQNFS